MTEKNYKEQIQNYLFVVEQYKNIESQWRHTTDVIREDMRKFLNESLIMFSLQNKVKINFSEFFPVHFYITYISENINKYYGGNHWIYINEHWVKTNNLSLSQIVYLHDLDLKHKPEQFLLENLAKFSSYIKEKTGLEIEYYERSLAIAKNITTPKNKDDLLTIHTQSTIVASGEKWSVGWDISDPWAVVRTKKGNLVVYWSTNGHGFGYDHCVTPDKPIDEFFDFLETPENILSEKIYNFLKNR